MRRLRTRDDLDPRAVPLHLHLVTGDTTGVAILLRAQRLHDRYRVERHRLLEAHFDPRLGLAAVREPVAAEVVVEGLVRADSFVARAGPGRLAGGEVGRGDGD